MGNGILFEKLKNINIIEKDHINFLRIFVIIGTALFLQIYMNDTIMAAWNENSNDLQSNLFRDNPDLEEIYDGKAVLKHGAQRDSVKIIEQALQDLGYPIPGGPNNAYGDITQAALMDYERDHRLEINGILESETMKSLDREIYAFENPSQTPEPTEAPSSSSNTPPDIPRGANTNTLSQLIGVILVISGLLFTSLTALKKDATIEIGISEKNMRYVGGTGVLLVILGVITLLLSSNLIPF